MNIKIQDEIQREVRSKPHITRSQYDIQKLRLDKLMKNPEKTVLIPEKPRERGPPAVPEIVRNVMGSSAGAGSGEFHVYRHLRRKEYARQNYMKRRADWEKMEEAYHNKVAENKRKCEESTAKRRAKRLRKKNNRMRNAKLKTEKKPDAENENVSEESGDSEGGQAEDIHSQNKQAIEENDTICDEKTIIASEPGE